MKFLKYMSIIAFVIINAIIAAFLFKLHIFTLASLFIILMLVGPACLAEIYKMIIFKKD